jgi:glycosyltransferase involved in cell wall biosynthesis
MKAMKEDIDILLITGGNPGDEISVATNIDKLLKILLNTTNNLHLVTFCNKELILGLNSKNIHSLKWYKNRFKQFLYAQILVSKVIFSISRTYNIKIVLFAFGQDLQLLPMILAKIVAKKTIIRSDGRATLIISYKKYFENHSWIKRYFYKIIEEINYRLVDVVLTECKYMILENNFQKYNSNVGSLFVDINKFKNEIPTYHRKYDIGYIGRLSEGKGMMNFVKAIPEIIKERDDLEFLIGGDGELRNEIEKYLEDENLNSKVKLAGWIPHDDLPKYLSYLKLLILPSYSEGLPNIVLESMACEVPVLATPVGGIPGVIKDGETGFIMENNSPECIAENVIKALNDSNLDIIVKNARKLVEKEYAYEAAVERYRKILENLGVKNQE